MPILCLIWPPYCHGIHPPPHELLFSRKPDTPGVLQKEPPETHYSYGNYIKELQTWLQSSYQTAKTNLKSQKEHSKEYCDRNVNTPLFSVWDKILLHDEKTRQGRSSKLSPPWIGPYKITDIDDMNITLKLPRNRTLKVHANRLKPFFGWLTHWHTQTPVRRSEPSMSFLLILAFCQ